MNSRTTHSVLLLSAIIGGAVGFAIDKRSDFVGATILSAVMGLIAGIFLDRRENDRRN